MNKILIKRVFRNLKNNFVRYFALFLLIVMGMYLVVSMIDSADTVINGVNEKAKINKLEDGEFKVFEKLSKNKTDGGMVIKIGEYYYSAIKVKEQIDEIIANTDIQDLENEDINEILKVALFKNKNIDLNEVEEVSAQIENLTKKEQVDKIQENEEIQDNSAETLENPQQEIETEVQGKKITEYTEIKEATNDIIEQEQNIEDVKQIISNLKEVRKTLRRQIQEMEEKLNNTILESDEPSSEVIQDIKKLRKIITEQKEKRKEVKQMIKKYKESKKIMKYTLKQQKEDRNNSIDELEI